MRIVSHNSDGSAAAMTWSGTSAAAALALDLIVASEGVSRPASGTVLAASFPHVQTAILAARRIQWALQGFADADHSGTTGAVILVQPTAEASGRTSPKQTSQDLEPPAIAVLEGAAPGKIFIRDNVATLLGPLPGLALSEARQGPWREIVWQTSATPPTFREDERALLQLLAGQGLEDPCPPEPEPEPIATPPPPLSVSKPISASRPISVSRPVSASRAVSGSRPVSGLQPRPVAPPVEPEVRAETAAVEESAEPGDLVIPRMDRDLPEGAGSRKWLILGGAAAAVVLIAGFLVAGFHHKPAGQPVGSSSGTAVPESPSPASPDAAKPANPSQTTIKPNPGRHKPSPTTDEQASDATRTPRPGIKPSPKAASDSCDLNETDIQRSLSRGENDLHAGKLSEAQAEYQTVLGCPSAREKAQEGLQRVKQRMEASGLSPDS